MKKVWKRLISTIGLIVCAGILFLTGLWINHKHIVDAEPQLMPNAARPIFPLIKEVNPFIGTGGYPWVCAHNFPGASLPFGMVRLSPETASTLTNKRGKSTSGYHYGDNKICGFSHTRLSGTGATDGGHFLVIPVSELSKHKKYSTGYYSRFSHKNEAAFPGYYAVKLSDEKVFIELTATERVGIHRYTFFEADEPHLLIDISNTIGDAESTEATVRILPEKQELEGSIRTFGTFARRYGGQKVFFVARFDQPFKSYSTWQSEDSSRKRKTKRNHIGADLEFSVRENGNVVVLKLAISYVSIDNARANLDAEAGNKHFDEVLAEAQEAWEDRLSLIKIDGATRSQKTIFYTALYRSFQMPTIFNDINGEYIGFDKQVHKVTDFQYFTDLSLWDTFRTLHPLYNIIARDDQQDMMVSLVKMTEEGGWLPRWPSGNGYTGSMLGTPSDITIAEAWLKGIRNFDIEYAYEAMRKIALGPTPSGAEFSGRRGVSSYLKYGYCAADEMDKAVSKTLEYAWADYSISQLANALGKKEDAELFAEHAQYYRNTWNPGTKYFHPRDSDGRFVKDFKPKLLSYLDFREKYTDDYVEGSALQWRWAVPFDAPGLISLFESPEKFVSELENFFSESDPRMGAWNPGPYYWHGNEPDIHSAYLFNAAERPDLTQKWVRWILNNKYDTSYRGLDGNDDGATLSAWYIFSSLGFYPLAGSDIYQLGAPLFKKAKIKIDGRTLLIETKNYAPENKYVQKVWLNDSVLTRSWIRHSEIANGGVLCFEMTDSI
ncbi:MAG: GH92 family glycosyl hydrolase [Bacteroidota bacterium]|nr:GH92 family glycosyl hydrolase [Bacteroidota bacterium]